MKLDIVRAWKDEAYREHLTEEEKAMLPANPAGELELTDADLETINGAEGIGIAGQARTWDWDCHGGGWTWNWRCHHGGRTWDWRCHHGGDTWDWHCHHGGETWDWRCRER